MKNKKIILGSESASQLVLDILDINMSKLFEPFKACMVGTIICDSPIEEPIIYGTVSIDINEKVFKFTAENGDVYKFSLVQGGEEL